MWLMENVKKKSNYQAPALDKGLDILEYLSGQAETRTQAEIAQALGRKQSELYRMLACLEERGYIAKGDGSTGYQLTLRLFELGHRQHTATALRTAAHIPMEALAEEMGQSCHLSFQHGSSVIVMMERMPARRVCLSVGEGATCPLSRTTSGKVLLSRRTLEDSNKLLADDPEFVRLSQVDQKRIQQEVAEARANGFLSRISELTDGVADIAIPVGVDGSGTLAALTVSYLSGTVDAQKNRGHYLEKALLCAAKINRNLGVFK